MVQAPKMSLMPSHRRATSMEVILITAAYVSLKHPVRDGSGA